MKNKRINLIVGLLMLVALGGALLLVRQNQNTQRGAYFAGTKLFTQPDDLTKNLGEVLIADLYVDSPEKVSSIDTEVCYGSQLDLGDNPSAKIMLNPEALDMLMDASIVTSGEADKKCLRLIAIANPAAKPEDLKSGIVKIATIRFDTVFVGSDSLEIIKTASKVGGYNPDPNATDASLSVTVSGGTNYTISNGDITLSPTPTVVYEGCETDADCKEGEYCYQPPMPTCPTGADCIMVMPHKYCKSDSAPVLNFKTSFGNVKSSSAKCVVDWPLQVIVLGSGQSKVYTGVKVSKVAEVDNKVIFEGSLPLEGFTLFSNVAAFIKGPKHLQMKYAIQDQKGPYDKAGGKLVLTNKSETSIVYDFSDYPMVPGDVVGPNTETPDGWIDGVDFAYVKARSLTHETVDEGGYLKADLDGNCQVNSNDINVLKISLQTKQGQLY